MKALILTIDYLTPHFDRRILDLDDQLRKLSIQTSIVTIGDHESIQWHRERPVFQISKFPREKFSELGKEEILNGAFEEFSISTREVQEVEKNVLKKTWHRMPSELKKYLKPFLIRYLNALNWLRNSKNQSSNLYGVDIASDYWDLSLALINANKDEKYDLYIGTDIPSGIASLWLANYHNGKSWYEAHEFATEQSWLQNQSGYSEELVQMEKILVQKSTIFTTVSQELTLEMATTFSRSTPVHTLTNATNFDFKHYVAPEVIQTFKEAKKDKRVLLFHGVLSDSRGLADFVEIFEETKHPEWKLILMGYGLGPKLERELQKASNTISLPPVSSAEILHIVVMSDAIAMPYPVHDINSKYGFANKLGDCIALQIPFLYNSELLSIDKVAKETSSGISFDWKEILVKPEELFSKLDQITLLQPDWQAAETLYGYTNFSNQVKQIVNLL
jgi:glycosyltransferase involved in cell wall biosynthesis